MLIMSQASRSLLMPSLQQSRHRGIISSSIVSREALGLREVMLLIIGHTLRSGAGVEKDQNARQGWNEGSRGNTKYKEIPKKKKETDKPQSSR